MILAAILSALFLWWFSTGLILFAVNRAGRGGRDGYQTVTVMTVPLLALAVFGVVWSSQQASLLGVYAGFISALGVWGWIELAFLTGVVTGPVRLRFPQGAPEYMRFGLALRSMQHHEIAVLSGFVVLVLLTSGAVNTVGMLTYAVLFFARISAKLNLYLGVPNINVEFLPAPIKHLESYFQIGPMNRFFPLTVTLLTLGLGWWVEQAITAPDQIAQVGYVLLASLTGLALVEHWFMVVRLPDAVLWRWIIDRTTSRDSREGAITQTDP